MDKNIKSTEGPKSTLRKSTNSEPESQGNSGSKIRTASAALKRLLDRDPTLTGEFVTLRDPQKIALRRKNGTLKIVSWNPEPSMTQQHFKEDVEINSIISRWKKTGQPPQTYGTSGVYADLSELPSFEQAMNTIVTGKNAFDALPSNIRERFSHDPQKLMEFLNDPENDSEAIKMQLKIPREQKSENQPNTNQNQPNSSTPNQPKQD